ncbi:cation diffusion facilitator family transporter [Vallitalea sp.]|uniref:cation diffusion facilitator family transporter n=1 Tax=Vallitalea sp. TaxID=1882829 RepID=UPI0025DF5A0C|nr:cation diffusion facilitator family transporter [Vallitalea sp.]MCT4686749.1 cation diffusion facilitator family transporter [Vallitalea sp.]
MNDINKYKKIKNVALSGILGNVFLLIIKLIIGFLSKSQAMIADGLNSGGDVFASTITFIGNKISSTPEDDEHPYGHGKAEYIFSMIISFSLFFVSFSIFKMSIDSLINKQEFEYSPWLIYIAIASIVIKLVLFIYSINIGRKYNSLLAIANAQDHRNDIFLSSLTLLSVILGHYNIYFFDGVVGILISLWIAYTGVSIFNQSYSVLMDTNIDSKVKQEMEKQIMSIEGLDHVDNINSKPIGLNFILIVKISVDANMTVYEGHSISAQIKKLLMEFDHIEDVVVHVNPAQYHR